MRKSFRTLNIKGPNSKFRLKAVYGEDPTCSKKMAVEIYDSDGYMVSMPVLTSANSCRCLSDWLTKAANKLQKEGQP